jgi:hypothetical protein
MACRVRIYRDMTYKRVFIKRVLRAYPLCSTTYLLQCQKCYISRQNTKSGWSFLQRPDLNKLLYTTEHSCTRVLYHEVIWPCGYSSRIAPHPRPNWASRNADSVDHKRHCTKRTR